MKQYERKPVYVDAEQFFTTQDPETYPEQVKWLERRHTDDPGAIQNRPSLYPNTGGCYIVDTPNGPNIISDGDWLVKLEKDDNPPTYWVITDEVFDLLYQERGAGKNS